LVKTIDNIEFIIIDKPQSLWDYWQLKKLFSNYNFDVLLAAQASMRTNLIYPLIQAKRKIGYDKIRGKEGHGWFINERISFKTAHTLEGFMQFAEHLGANVSEVIWDLPLEPDATKWVQEFLDGQHLNAGPIVILNAAASKPERTWSLDGYIQVIRHLQDQYHANVILCGGPSELDKKLAKEIQLQMKVLDLVGKTKLPQLLALVARADLVLCPDTGPSHMAAALNTPVIALHAVTRPEISGPYGQLDHVINGYEKAKAILTPSRKKPTNKDWFSKVHDPKAMSFVKLDEVKAKIATILA
jgi:heptosyltransferase I